MLNQHKPLKKQISVFSVINGLFMILFTLYMVYPFYQCLIVSISNGADIDFNGIVYLLPRKYSLESYTWVLSNSQFLIALRNSALRTLIGASFCVLLSSMYAYAISHKELVIRKFFTTIGIISMYFSGGFIPTFLVVKNLGLYNNFLVYIFLQSFSMFYALVFVAYFKSIPASIEESAIIDGAHEGRIFFDIIIPIAKPIFAVVFLFSAVSQWNAWFDCMIYTDNKNLETLSYMFAKLMLAATYLKQAAMSEMLTPEQMIALRSAVTSQTLQMAMLVLAILPIMVIYPFMQKYFVKGIMIGSVKG